MQHDVKNWLHPTFGWFQFKPLRFQNTGHNEDLSLQTLDALRWRHRSTPWCFSPSRQQTELLRAAHQLRARVRATRAEREFEPSAGLKSWVRSKDWDTNSAYLILTILGRLNFELWNQNSVNSKMPAPHDAGPPWLWWVGSTVMGRRPVSDTLPSEEMNTLRVLALWVAFTVSFVGTEGSSLSTQWSWHSLKMFSSLRTQLGRFWPTPGCQPPEWLPTERHDVARLREVLSIGLVMAYILGIATPAAMGWASGGSLWSQSQNYRAWLLKR